MGRAKQSMKLITEGRNRNLTFRKRKEGLKKKAHELQVLCDVEVCLIIYGSDGPTVRELEIWPSNPASVQLLINSYNNQPIEDRNRRTETLSNFFDKKRQNVENDLLKLRKKNEMAKYTTWDARYDNLSFEHLREFGGLLEAKIGVVKNRIETIKGAQNCSLSSNIVSGFMLPQHQPIVSSFNPSEINFPVNYYPFQHTQQFVPNYPMNNFPYVGGCFDDTALGKFSTPCVGYFGNGNTESQMMAPYMQFTKMESSSVWYEQMMKNQSRDQV